MKGLRNEGTGGPGLARRSAGPMKAGWVMPDERIGRAVCAVALAVLQAGCAATASGNHPPGDRDCPVGLTLVCDADRPGARRYSGCRCVSRGDIDDFLRHR